MPGISELARCEAEAQSEVACCPGLPPSRCPHLACRPVKSTGPLADAEPTPPAASPFARAMVYALAGQPIPRSVIASLREEGGDMVALSNAITRHRRA